MSIAHSYSNLHRSVNCAFLVDYSSTTLKEEIVGDAYLVRVSTTLGAKTVQVGPLPSI